MSIKVQNTPNRAAFDVQSSADIREQFKKDPQQGLQAAAQQFEAMFLQMVMKSMRDATPQDSLLQSDSTRFYTSLLDQQMAQNMANQPNGLGFAKMIEQQLGGRIQGNELADAAARAANPSGNPLPLTAPSSGNLRHIPIPASFPPSGQNAQAVISAERAQETSGSPAANPQEFVGRVWGHAVDASRSTGISPQFVVAHAALESGWGRNEIRKADGSSSFNLFGIKAGKNWNGPVVEAATTEYVDGQPRQVVERFRSYSSYEEGFRDYAALLRSNSRYSGVIGTQDGTEFARRLQQAGYATDPMYGDKLSRIINGPTLRQALIG
ncbi:flagellar assembly peptidoglycan hydrolase FlgJ [Dechloromonas sp.]|uniref:flagellar assembly peptidoglycan hydrolase FlgJ n=1 Tax=Dechloromonas sp. TaxID=1917218 RepID=UPI00216BCF09|nr:flagellar assembly peptidoglycan hydrolase FlgJ [Dechloromonas sp.]MBU3696417.1 flagellar assembly peptidoglycan hydrolase FlgJ [Dechloromonas sp.]